MVRSARKIAGTEAAYAKLPFMPRWAVILDQGLVMAASDSQVTHMRVAAVGVLLAFYFGWRSSTVSALCLADVTLSSEG